MMGGATIKTPAALGWASASRFRILCQECPDMDRLARFRQIKADYRPPEPMTFERMTSKSALIPGLRTFVCTDCGELETLEMLEIEESA
jgi:hypothetical protein